MKSVPLSFIAKAKGACFALLILWLGAITAARAATVTIDARTVYQRMEGFGTSSRVFDDPHTFNTLDPATMRARTVLTTAQQDAVLDRLYVDLGLTRDHPVNPDVGVLTGVTYLGVEPSNDNADPSVADLSKFDFSWKNLDAHVDFISRARQRGVTTYFLSPLNRQTWMGTSTANDAAEYAEWLLAMVLRSQTLGVTLPYLSVANEPSYSRNTMSGAFIRDVIKNLGPRLRAAGLNTLFVVPDDVRSSDAAAKTQTIMADPVARSYVGAFATHLYDEPLTNVGQMKALSQQYGLPLWMTETSLSLASTFGFGSGPFDGRI